MDPQVILPILTQLERPRTSNSGFGVNMPAFERPFIVMTPHVDSEIGGRDESGPTDRAGKRFLPSMTSLMNQGLFLDPKGLPAAPLESAYDWTGNPRMTRFMLTQGGAFSKDSIAARMTASENGRRGGGAAFFKFRVTIAHVHSQRVFPGESLETIRRGTFEIFLFSQMSLSMTIQLTSHHEGL
jgi:hypothetical protein